MAKHVVVIFLKVNPLAVVSGQYVRERIVVVPRASTRTHDDEWCDVAAQLTFFSGPTTQPNARKADEASIAVYVRFLPGSLAAWG